MILEPIEDSHIQEERKVRSLLEEDLLEFITSPGPSIDRPWFGIKARLFDLDKCQIYIRNSFYYSGGVYYTSIVIANINVHNPGHGYGSALIEEIHSNHNKQRTVLECVVNEKFANFLDRSGWQRDVNKETDVFFYKDKD